MQEDRGQFGGGSEDGGEGVYICSMLPSWIDAESGAN